MSSTWRERLRHALAYRLAVWYAVLFLVSVVALVAILIAGPLLISVLAYRLLSGR
jgi:hypothetical protein